jgi:hypothetical protein
MRFGKILNSKAFFFILLALIAGSGIFRWRSERARDYYQFWVVGQAIRSMELTNIYGAQDRHRIGQHFLDQAIAQKASPSHLRAASYRRVINPAGTPFLYGVFYLTSKGNYDFDYTVFRIISYFVYLLSIIVLCDLLKIPRLLTIFLIVLLTEYFGPFRLDVMEGNVNQLQVGIVAFLLWLRSRKKTIGAEALSGAVCGLLIMFKPNMAPVGIFLLGGALLLRSIRPTLILAGAMGLGMGFGYGLPLILFGRVCNWEQWRAAFPQLVFTPEYFYRSFLGQFFNATSLAPYFVLTAALAAAPFLLWLARSGLAKPPGPVEQSGLTGTDSRFILEHLWLGLAVCVYLLGSTLVHYHYFLLIVPFLLVLFSNSRGYAGFPSLKGFRWMALGLIVYLLMALRAPYIGDGKDPLYSDWRLGFIGILLLYGFGLYRLRRERRIDSTRAKD